jgi:hypothetical protein
MFKFYFLLPPLLIGGLLYIGVSVFGVVVSVLLNNDE